MGRLFATLVGAVLVSALAGAPSALGATPHYQVTVDANREFYALDAFVNSHSQMSVTYEGNDNPSIWGYLYTPGGAIDLQDPTGCWVDSGLPGHCNDLEATSVNGSGQVSGFFG